MKETPKWLDFPRIDARWEVSAAPTPEMWEAMQETKIGMADFGEDPTVRELESFGAELFGHEAALLVPTVTVGTVLSMMNGASRGSTVIVEERAHILWVEELHISALCGAAPLLIRGDKFGAIPIEAIEEALDRQHYGHKLPTSLVCIENTHNICGGTMLTPGYTSTLVEFCHSKGLKVYLDGARLMNAAVSQNVAVDELSSQVDYVVIGLNKGLAAPYGALLCGKADFIEGAKADFRRIGSMGMHKAGYYAAAALVGLRKMVNRLNEDHARAQRLAKGLAAIDGLDVDLETVQTNLVRCETASSGIPASDIAYSLVELGIAVHPFEAYAFKCATHLEISDEDVEDIISSIEKVMGDLRR